MNNFFKKMFGIEFFLGSNIKDSFVIILEKQFHLYHKNLNG